MHADEQVGQSRRRRKARDSARLLEPSSEEQLARRRRVANLKRKAAMLAFHARNRDPVSGKSATAQAGGRAAWQKRAAAHPGGGRGLALDLALARWYGPQDYDWQGRGRRADGRFAEVIGSYTEVKD